MLESLSLMSFDNMKTISARGKPETAGPYDATDDEGEIKHRDSPSGYNTWAASDPPSSATCLLYWRVTYKLNCTLSNLFLVAFRKSHFMEVSQSILLSLDSLSA